MGQCRAIPETYAEKVESSDGCMSCFVAFFYEYPIFRREQSATGGSACRGTKTELIDPGGPDPGAISSDRNSRYAGRTVDFRTRDHLSGHGRNHATPVLTDGCRLKTLSHRKI